MKVHFLGSASSEGMPNPFCHCEICQQARQLKGKNLRCRSSVVIDETMMIDMAPEFSYQIMRDNIDATQLTDLLFTHTHPDHFNVGDLFSRMEGFGHGITHPLHIYGGDVAINGCLTVLPGFSKERFQFHLLAPYTPIERNGYTITPLLANHAKWEHCYLYHIEKDGKKILYGHDSGWFPAATWQWLADNYLDLVILECTYGYNQNAVSDNHMSFETVFATQEKLHKLRCIDEQSQIIVSHICHTAGFLHDELVNIFAEKNITVAFDGMTTVIK